MRHHWIAFIFVALLGALMLVGCTGEPAATPLPTTPTASPTPTEVATSSVSVQALTPTLTLPVLAGVPVPKEPITLGSIDKVVELAALSQDGASQAVGISDLALSIEGNLFVAHSTDPTGKLSPINGIQVWNLHTGQLIHTFAEQAGPIDCLALSAHSTTLAACHYEVSVLDATTGQLIWDGWGSTRVLTKVSQLALSPDGLFIAGVSQVGTDIWADVYSLQQKDFLYTLAHTGDNGASEVVFSPDGTKIASAAWDGTLRLWDTQTGKLLREFTIPQRHGAGLAFSPNGQIIAASGDNIVWLWDVETGEPLHQLEGQNYYLFNLAFSPDDSLLALGARISDPKSEGKEQTIQLWDVEKGVLLRSLDYTSSVSRLIFSHDGKLLISGDLDGTIRLWGVPVA